MAAVCALVAHLFDVILDAVGEGHEGVGVDEELLAGRELRSHTGKEAEMRVS